MLDTPHRTLSISIHALHEESDAVPSGHWERYALFQSTLSMRRATSIWEPMVVKLYAISIHALHEESDASHGSTRVVRQISIHALHEESDTNPNPARSHSRNFNPRSP